MACLISLLLSAAAAAADDSDAPAPAAGPERGGGAAAASTEPRAELARELDSLRAERKALRTTRDTAAPAKPARGAGDADETARLRSQIGEYVQRLSERAADDQRPDQSPASGSARGARGPRTLEPATQAARKNPAGTSAKRAAPAETPVDAMAMAQALFRSGEYEAALEAYRAIDPHSLRAEDQLAFRYFMATCQRRLGNAPEAAVLYREVANAKGDDQIIECARWQLGALQWRQDLETQIEQLRRRREALEAKP